MFLMLRTTQTENVLLNILRQQKQIEMNRSGFKIIISREQNVKMLEGMNSLTVSHSQYLFFS